MRHMGERGQPAWQPGGKDAGLTRGIRRQPALLASANNEAVLWSQFAERRHGDYFWDARILLIGFAQGDLQDLRQSLRALGVPTVASAPGMNQLSDVTRLTPSFTYMLVNFDTFDDPATGVDALITFRAQQSDAVIVVCSAHVGGDDTGHERRAICDATLRLPASNPRVANVLVAASRNHAMC